MDHSHGARRALAIAFAHVPLAQAFPATAASPLDEIVVTASRMHAPLLVVADAKAPHQPLPARDGADYLKSVPGFSVVRKGGTDGDPVFRGMAASRVNIQLDGQQVLGGCGMRMDPPTAYVFPEAYDRIVVVKGPQTVLGGPGNSAASVSFERDVVRFEQTGARTYASVVGASFGRSDLVADLRVGTPKLYGQLSGTRASSDDYEDGSGETVHSAYERWNANAALGWTPSPGTRFELAGAQSDGEAAYADRAMDGAAFDRDNLALRIEQASVTEHVQNLEFIAYYNYVDHVMDNYSLRAFTPTPTMPFRAASNPDRRTTGGRLAVDVTLDDEGTATIGADLQENSHSVRSTMNQAMKPYESLPRVQDAWFRSVGLFGESNVPLDSRRRVIAGLRVDLWRAKDERATVPLGMMMSAPNPTANAARDDALPSGFVRYEHDVAQGPATLYAGLGHVERFPDYWELVSAGKESQDSLSAFFTEPERTTQFDAGIVYGGQRFSASLSAYYGATGDFILIESNYPKGMRRTTVTRNVDARTWGGEADATYALTARWSLNGTLAWSAGDNETDDLPLAQMPPLEVRAGLSYEAERWFAGALWRVVAEQDRYAVGQGSVVGQDIGRTGGFGVVSLNGGWRAPAGLVVTAGVDNLYDETYAEHISRAGALVPGYEQTTRVNEPGRAAWIKAAVAFGGAP